MSSTLRLSLQSTLFKRSNCISKSQYLDFVDLVSTLTSSVRQNSTGARKITTHYTIYPREKDERWKGLICWIRKMIIFRLN